jgi:hypothetical protein
MELLVLAGLKPKRVFGSNDIGGYEEVEVVGLS